MRRSHAVRGFWLLAAFFIVGCATLDPATVRGPIRLDPMGPNVRRATNAKMTLYVEEYATAEKSEVAFGTRLTEEGVLPLLILVENRREQGYGVKARDIIARGDKALKALTPEETAGKVEQLAGGKASLWVPVIAIPIAAVAEARHTSQIKKQLDQDFAVKGFADGIIMPNEERSGFLFFELEAGRKDLRGLSLRMTAGNIVTEDPVIIDVPLPETSFPPKKEAGDNGAAGHGW